MGLDAFVNVTDFTDLTTLLKIFEQDKLDACLERLRSESSIGLDYIREETLSRLREKINTQDPRQDLSLK